LRRALIDSWAVYAIKVELFMPNRTRSDDDRYTREECFENPFWIGETEVTNRFYGSNSSADKEAP
jgi:hypothetical protein